MNRSGRMVALAATCWTLGMLAILVPAAGAAFHPRIGNAMGLVPSARVPAVGPPDLALSTNLPEVYHGGSVMRGVTLHTIFWAPRGYGFAGPPTPQALGYVALVQRYFADVAHDSGQTTNEFSVLAQYGDGGGPAPYSVAYSPAADSIQVTDPYPPTSQQCGSPAGIGTCVTDVELQQEIDKVIATTDPSGRGLNNLWLIFLPPNVDTCDLPGQCGTNVYAGYHSLFDLGHGTTIYAVLPDPLIEAAIPPGGDPQGNPDAEVAIGAAAHEAVEAMTDPEGNGWMDPNGNEVADKCELGPQVGTPIGYAPNGSPYNQLIAGDPWLIQGMWSNATAGCVQSSSASTSALPLPRLHLSQFSPRVSGSIGAARGGVSVTVSLQRAGAVVARARTATRADGSWGPVSIKSLTRARVEAFGDDRDKIFVDYGRGGPVHDTILTGNGGNAFTESGWTGWFDLDHGFAVASFFDAGGVLLGPCFQTGVLVLTVDRKATESPTDLCGTGPDAAIVPTGPIAPNAVLRLDSEDNRAVTVANPNGALVTLAVTLGEANSVASTGNGQVLFQPSGFPTCMADLRSQRVTCTGLVPGTRYALTRRRGRASTTVHAKADGSGAVAGVGLPGSRGLAGGDVVTLRNSAGVTLTSLHVAHLRVDLAGGQTAIASGTCEPGDYYGPAPSVPPTNAAVGAPGISGSGTICPLTGRAKGMSAGHIEQTDDLSGGTTLTDVPELSFTSPSDGATLYGPFTALAGAGIRTPQHAVVTSGAKVAVTITPGSGGAPVFRAANVNTAHGAPVPSLPTGTYKAKWVVIDANGDTRTVVTRFVEQG